MDRRRSCSKIGFAKRPRAGSASPGKSRLLAVICLDIILLPAARFQEVWPGATGDAGRVCGPHCSAVGWGASAPLSCWDDPDGLGAQVGCVDGFAVLFVRDGFDVAACLDEIAGVQVGFDPGETGSVFPEGDGVPAGFFAHFACVAVGPAFGGCDVDLEALGLRGDFADVALDLELCVGEHLGALSWLVSMNKGRCRVMDGSRRKTEGPPWRKPSLFLKGRKKEGGDGAFGPWPESP